MVTPVPIVPPATRHTGGYRGRQAVRNMTTDRTYAIAPSGRLA